MINHPENVNCMAFVSEKFFRHFSEKTFSAESTSDVHPQLENLSKRTSPSRTGPLSTPQADQSKEGNNGPDEGQAVGLGHAVNIVGSDS